MSETTKNSTSAQGSSAEVTRAAILQKFHKIFELPPDEKLVNYYSGTYWQGRKPIQGRLYFSVNFICFYSFIVGKQTKIQIRWTEITVGLCDFMHFKEFLEIGQKRAASLPTNNQSCNTQRLLRIFIVDKFSWSLQACVPARQLGHETVSFLHCLFRGLKLGTNKYADRLEVLQ